MNKKKVKDLEKGDKVYSGNGEPKTVQEVTHGLYMSSKTITFTDGTWACEGNNVEVEIR